MKIDAIILRELHFPVRPFETALRNPQPRILLAEIGRGLTGGECTAAAAVFFRRSTDSAGLRCQRTGSDVAAERRIRRTPGSSAGTGNRMARRRRNAIWDLDKREGISLSRFWVGARNHSVACPGIQATIRSWANIEKELARATSASS